MVWARFGNVPNYVEPFFGSGAVLLGRPSAAGIETINDKDCFVANFWRALKNDPESVTLYADNPINEADLQARHIWLVTNSNFIERMKNDPDYFDAKVAGWWVWGLSSWIGSGWCKAQDSEDVAIQRPQLSNSIGGGQGVNRTVHHKRPQLLGTTGTNASQRRPHLTHHGQGIHSKSVSLLGYMLELTERLRRVRVCCGDWSRVCGPTPTYKQGLTGVFLDPPYSADAERTGDIYSTDSGSVAHTVREWAIENGTNRLMRIALCGYEGEHEMPPSWECIPWKTYGGLGSMGNGQGRENSNRERIWFSPHCLKASDSLFGMSWGRR